jgi:hypothetical protein
VQPQTHGLLEFSFVSNRRCLILFSNRGASHFKLWTMIVYSNSMSFPIGGGQECGRDSDRGHSKIGSDGYGGKSEYPAEHLDV